MSKNIVSMDGWRVKPMLAVPSQNYKLHPGAKHNFRVPGLPDHTKLIKILGSDEYWAEPKINGHRCIYVDGGLYSRQLGVDGQQVCNSELLPHILNELHEQDPQGHLILDGELGFDVADSSNEDVSTILGAGKDKALDRLRARALVYFVFDIIRLPDGEDISEWPLEARRRMLDGIFTTAFTRYVIPTEVYDPQKGYNLEEIMDYARKSNWEGLMFKNRNSKYIQGGRRENTWYKWKISNVIDEQVFITDILDPERFYRNTLGQRDYGRQTRLYTEGLSGRVKIAQIDPLTGAQIDRGKVGAWTDEQRRLFATEPEKWIGKVFDISAFRITKDGKYISPKFVRWRDELKPEDCSSEPNGLEETELPELLQGVSETERKTS